ncbi:early protein E4 [human papillomavirus 82]|uniref:Early protein E4 n=1 Tax=Human papillomavirus 82 TaxID=129724 RepID=Q993Z6_HPV82|nr:putative E4 protein [human papillomavirus 82]ALJ32341.1 early protein E4 [human papillomavirus 82]ALJ32349.1 early protein E4 [human papillomavirus 82]ALJ32357.1 early protein E4 [human papillomavirus 82]ALJ32365.1 early protein E4 [human papillomavirus 82]
MYLVPAETRYPLLQLLNSTRTPPRPIPIPPPWAPKKPRHHNNENDSELLSPTPPQSPHCPWTLVTTKYTVELEAQTLEGTKVQLKLRL